MEILPVSTSNNTVVSPHGIRGTNDSVATSFQQSLIHYHMLMIKLQRHTICIKIQESRKLKFKDKDFRNSDIQDLPKRYQDYQDKRLSREIVSMLSR
ncbi:hypothetical protein Tco_0267673 [Tanacetum coccineum]